MIRFDFPARGNMPPVKIFWYDGLAQTPEVPSVPKGELSATCRLFVRKTGVECGRSAANAAKEYTGFVGRVFDYEKYQAARNDSEAVIPKPNGSVFIGSKGMLTTGTYGEQTRSAPGGQDAGLPLPRAVVNPITRSLSRLDSRGEGRRPRVFQLQRCGSICRVDASRCYRFFEWMASWNGMRRRGGSQITTMPTNS